MPINRRVNREKATECTDCDKMTSISSICIMYSLFVKYLYFSFTLIKQNTIFAPLLKGKIKIMKKDLHPKNYRLVVFKDLSNDYSFITKSCIDTKESIKWEDGNEYPLIKLEISHTSHPFYTGKMKLVDTAGRIDKFKNRYNR
jgi:large subunit ribosomal protein L31